jgi:acyl dehydratase
MSTEWVLDRLPSMARYYPRTVVPRRSSGTPELPRLSVRVAGVTPRVADIHRYRGLCGVPPSNTLPHLYPQLLAGPLHLALMTHPSFPFRAAGVVHVRNRVVQSAAIFEPVPLDLHAWVEGCRPVARGWEFDLHTEASFRGELRWRAITTVLAMGRSGVTASADTGMTPPPEAPTEVLDELDLPSDLGRRYCALTGDINPIHMYALTARLFGFPRAIIHGTWTAARAVGALGDRMPASPFTSDVRFRRPVLLPSRIRILGGSVEDGACWQVVEDTSGRVLVEGEVRSGEPG